MNPIVGNTNQVSSYGQTYENPITNRQCQTVNCQSNNQHQSTSGLHQTNREKHHKEKCGKSVSVIISITKMRPSSRLL